MVQKSVLGYDERQLQIFKKELKHDMMSLGESIKRMETTFNVYHPEGPTILRASLLTQPRPLGRSPFFKIKN